jgi:hypothetical protein
MIYFIQDGPYIKIGHTDNVTKRLDLLQVGNPRPLRIVATMDGDVAFERLLHHKFRAFRVRREWFAGRQALLDYIKYATPYPNPNNTKSLYDWVDGFYEHNDACGISIGG